MADYTPCAFDILRLIAECGRVSKDAIDLMDYNRKWLRHQLNILIKGKCIRENGNGRSKCYTIRQKGRDYLQTVMPERYTKEVLDYGGQLAKYTDYNRDRQKDAAQANRSVLRGEAAVALWLAGFGVCVCDKPALPAQLPAKMSADIHSDETALTEVYQNSDFHPYTQGGKEDHLYYATPVNCYYDSTELKALSPLRDAINYSRACGVLLTPDTLYRVFHTRNLSMKFQETGEGNLRNYLYGDTVFKGNLPGEAKDGPVIVFGDTLDAALSILDNHERSQGTRRLRMQQLRHAKKTAPIVKEDGKKFEKDATLLTVSSLGSPLYFRPLDRRALPLLSVMRYPRWQQMFIEFICKYHFKRKEVNRTFVIQEIGTAVKVIIMADLNLSDIGLALSVLDRSNTDYLKIVCFEWQSSFFRQIIKLYIQDDQDRPDVWLEVLPDNDLVILLNLLEKKWGD